MTNQDLFLLVIRGTLTKSVLDEARINHNETAGTPEGVAMARSLGDLSHNVYVPLMDAPAVATELLIFDTWNSIEGLGKFFASPQLEADARRNFKSKDPNVYTISDIYSFSLPSPRNKPERFIGMIRGNVRSRAEAKDVFDRATKGGINKSRALGQISHHMFWKLGQPGQPESNELIGIDVWHDAEGMMTWYENGPKDIYDVFDGEPQSSVWKQPAGHWVEW